MRASASATSPRSITASRSRCSSPIAAGEAQDGRSWAMQSRISPLERGVQALQARAARGVRERLMEAHVGVHDLAPARVHPQRGQRADRGVHAVERRVAREQLAHDQALDRDPDAEEVQHFLAREQRHERAAIALALEQPFVAERLDGGAHGRTGHAELAREVDLGQRRARLDRAVEDLLAQRDHDGFSGGDRGDGESAHQAAISVPMPAAIPHARVDAGLGFRARFVASPAAFGGDLIERARQTEIAGQLQHPPPQRGAAVERAFSIVSRELVHDGFDGSSPTLLHTVEP